MVGAVTTHPFRGQYTLGHLALGLLTSVLPPKLQAGVALTFLVYQVSEAEPWPQSANDVAEFAAGYLAGKVADHGGMI